MGAGITQAFFTNCDLSFIVPMPSILQFVHDFSFVSFKLPASIAKKYVASKTKVLVVCIAFIKY